MVEKTSQSMEGFYGLTGEGEPRMPSLMNIPLTIQATKPK